MSQIRLRKRIPKERTLEQVRNHYEVEKAIAGRLKAASREERKKIYAVMYDELFAKVPDHPRLVGRESVELTEQRNRMKQAWVEKFLGPNAVFVEFAPGDCAFAKHVCRFVRRVYAIDISDQSKPQTPCPDNYTLVVYDGYTLDMGENVADIAFSDQFIEHLHPDDVVHHFGLVYRILKRGGVYVFRAPHRFLGPHDISKYFATEAEGFHLWEPTFTDVARILTSLGYSRWTGHRRVRRKYVGTPFVYFSAIESILAPLPRPLRKFLSRLPLPRQLYMYAFK